MAEEFKSPELSFLRRSFIKKIGLLGGAFIAGNKLAEESQAKTNPTVKVDPPSWPYPYVNLDPNRSADLAYAGFQQGKCCYGTFSGIIKNLAEVYGEPFTSFPVDMMRFGEGGITGWGSVCGCLNGASAAINLVCSFENATTLINEIIAWYAETELPIYIPSSGQAIVVNASHSPLCHVSVSKWCDKSGATATSAARKERCARLTADVSKKATEILNTFYAGTFASEHQPAASVSSCMTCHGTNVMNNTLGKMDCDSCHQPHTTLPYVTNWGGSSVGCDLNKDGMVDGKDLVRFIELKRMSQK